MSEIAAHLTATAVAEIRDADGNLISSEPVTVDLGDLTAEQVRNLTQGEPS